MKSGDVYEEFLKPRHLFDLSNYPKDSKLFDPVNEKVIGKIKDVSGEKINDAFVGLKSKMHFIKNVDGKESKDGNRAKGVNIATNFTESKDILFNKKSSRHTTRRIQSNNHSNNHIFTCEVNKTSSSCFDDKRLVLDDGIHALAYLHKGYKNQKDVLEDSHRPS